MTASLDISVLSTQKLLVKLGLNPRGLSWLLRRPASPQAAGRSRAFWRCLLPVGPVSGLRSVLPDLRHPSPARRRVVCARVSVSEVCVYASVVCARAGLHMSVRVACVVLRLHLSVCGVCGLCVCVQRVSVCVSSGVCAVCAEGVCVGSVHVRVRCVWALCVSVCAQHVSACVCTHGASVSLRVLASASDGSRVAVGTGCPWQLPPNWALSSPRNCVCSRPG